ncbi:papain-like cysteine protease family protein [Catenulispora pinistramenti]|uniref:papain-like cysteine protease family protein n=1 Tax=Catenulispora pinistramenti TaxID=2705254 RepID=UPI0027DE469A|nr:papain-like cysteine protease family protein [Catenulispora pinistramenti]
MSPTPGIPPTRRTRHFRAAAALAAVLSLLTFVAVPAASASTANQLNISMQQQQASNWCWAASGDTVAAFYGHDYSQNQFCDMAFGNNTNESCANDEASLADDQTAFSTIGISPGNYITGYLYYSAVIREIDAGRPVMARIQWSSGGGHMEVLYGYDQSQNWVYWGDPWPSDDRYNWGDYNYYVSNNSFEWTHSLDYIGA